MINENTIANALAPGVPAATHLDWRAAAHTFLNWCKNPNGGDITFEQPPATAAAPTHTNSSSHSLSGRSFVTFSAAITEQDFKN
mmetsp:Transcript_6869/g.25676  ORF Transcript_6869/g.25676 Transcript_6869/m.25676 type:complete len:84 (+) Transcript_6869:2215-2466(+)